MIENLEGVLPWPVDGAEGRLSHIFLWGRHAWHPPRGHLHHCKPLPKLGSHSRRALRGLDTPRVT